MAMATTRRIPFLEHLGVEIVEFGRGRAKLALRIEPHHCNSMRVAHGGVVMTVLDAALTIAARAAHTDDYDSDVNCITVEMKATFIAPGSGSLTVDGVCLHKGASLMFCEGEARDGSGTLVARASGTFKLWRPRAGGAERPADG
jgi:uncharacterized protein (TIGR00369 family)